LKSNTKSKTAIDWENFVEKIFMADFRPQKLNTFNEYGTIQLDFIAVDSLYLHGMWLYLMRLLIKKYAAFHGLAPVYHVSSSSMAWVKLQYVQSGIHVHMLKW